MWVLPLLGRCFCSIQESRLVGWRDCPGAKSTFCSCGRYRFHSQPSHGAHGHNNRFYGEARGEGIAQILKLHHIEDASTMDDYQRQQKVWRGAGLTSCPCWKWQSQRSGAVVEPLGSPEDCGSQMSDTDLTLWTSGLLRSDCDCAQLCLLGVRNLLAAYYFNL